MQEIKIVYIDDKIDEILSKYLSQIYPERVSILNLCKADIKVTYDEIVFDGSQGYESLFYDLKVRSANVILIDNHLFEERSSETGRFSGKEFKIILRKLFPFIEVLIITQNSLLRGENIIHKFSNRTKEDSDTYYDQSLAPKLGKAINSVLEFDSLASSLQKSTDVGKALVDKILLSLQGDDSFDSFTKKDIDDLIASFEELKGNYGSK